MKEFYGGGERIRTSDTCYSMPPFQGGALDRYATPPKHGQAMRVFYKSAILVT